MQTTLYPLNALSALDNTCRDAFGFIPTGTEAGLCAYVGSVSGTVFRDRYSGNPASTIDNGILDPNEPPYPHGEVRLGQGACPLSPGYKSAMIGADGRYSFPAQPISAYCLKYLNSFPGSIPTSPTVVEFSLGPDQNKVVNFGVDWTELPK